MTTEEEFWKELYEEMKFEKAKEDILRNIQKIRIRLKVLEWLIIFRHLFIKSEEEEQEFKRIIRYYLQEIYDIIKEMLEIDLVILEKRIINNTQQ